MKFLGLLLITLFFTCSSDAPAPTPAARIERRTTQEDLATITLRPDAEAALSLKTERIERAQDHMMLTTSGEVMVSAGRDVVLAAPVGGRIMLGGATPHPGDRVRAGQLLFSIVPLAAVDRDVRARSNRDLEVAKSDLELAQHREQRAQAMVEDKSGSVRALEEAHAQRQVAEATVASAASRVQTMARGSLDSDVSLSLKSPTEGILRSVKVTQGQSVPVGAVLVEIAASGRWVRATLTAGDSARTKTIHSAFGRQLGSPTRIALVETAGPPSADPLRGTVDRFFILPQGSDLVPGERIVVEIQTGAAPNAAQFSAIRCTAIVRDAEGGSWLYTKSCEHQFRRRRVEVMERDGDRCLLRAGLAETAQVVTVGAAELWGFELGADR